MLKDLVQVTRKEFARAAEICIATAVQLTIDKREVVSTATVEDPEVVMAPADGVWLDDGSILWRVYPGDAVSGVVPSSSKNPIASAACRNHLPDLF